MRHCSLVFLALLSCPMATWAQAKFVALDQGTSWGDEQRYAFYKQNQGARLIPLAWASALKQANGQPFFADGLARYGYLPNERPPVAGLPVGFTVAAAPDVDGDQILGMTCAACHTRQLRDGETLYRVDGGPALTDFYSFLVDLDSAVDGVLKDDQQFKTFADAVLGSPQPADRTRLHNDLAKWFEPFHAIVSGGVLAAPQWGIGRVDAVGMILNRVTGLDIGTNDSRIIRENIRPAAAPVRYPFLWNAPRQDKTQWPGLADNGSDLLALARNLGQVYGVFATYQPVRSNWHLLGVNYLNNSSVDFDGLLAIEELVKRMGPPKFPKPIDARLAERGKAIFALSTAKGGCADCHAAQPGETRFFNQKTWRTLLQDTGTDSKQYELLNWTAKTGVLEGVSIPTVSKAFGKTEKSVDILRVSVVGSILQYYVPVLLTGSKTAAPMASTSGVPPPGSTDPAIEELKRGAYKVRTGTDRFAYESRVLEGIWAAAPYLHNGSVPTLADLLKPVQNRPEKFDVGSDYDLVNLGLAQNQRGAKSTVVTTDCSGRNSGNSRCGHEFGVRLSDADKAALLEYLKAL